MRLLAKCRRVKLVIREHVDYVVLVGFLLRCPDKCSRTSFGLENGITDVGF